MLKDSRLLYLFVYVKDVSASRAYYEQKLGFRLLEEDADSAKYDAGEIILALNKADNYGIKIGTTRDDTSIIVFHVDDIDAMRSAMEARGVEFSGATDRYDIGATATFYDPDGHCFALYEPSAEAMMWPSADRIRKILAANGASVKPDQAGRESVKARERHANNGLTLGTRKMVYLFLFVRDTAESLEFYNKKLGLTVVENSPEAGVAKYNAGGIILATHLVASEEGARAKPEDLQSTRSIAPVFHVSDLESVFQKLSADNVAFVNGPTRSAIGVTAQFKDPSGHVLYLYEPSAQALDWPSGDKVKHILTEQL
jgi:predicted enzyme related to lactoylglutathione lyase